MLTLDSLLNNRWIAGTGAPERLVDPTSGQVVAETSTEGLDRGAALAYAREVGGPALRAMTFAERGALLKAMARAIHAHREALLTLSTEAYGATRGDGKFDVDGAAGTLAFYAGLGKRLGDARWRVDGDDEGVMDSKRLVGRHLCVPRHGVAIHINAFNFPAWGMAEKLAVSLLAGVPALVKPATPGASVAWRIVRIWHEEGLLPDGAVSLLCGEPGDLLDHVGPQDVVAFTGSSATGRLVRGHPAVLATGCRVNVEADSLNASVLGPDVAPGDATFEQFAREVVHELSQKAGQKCTAVRRVLVPEALLEDVREAFADHLSRLVMGDPSDKATRVGPLATERQHTVVEAGLSALSALTDPFAEAGGDVPAGGAFVRPQVRVRRAGVDDAWIHTHEVFGPVATVLPYDGAAETAVREVARGGGGLVCAVYSDDRDWARDVILGVAPWHGRVWWGSAKVADALVTPGTVLPGFIHGGPGKAGGGEELGGVRALGLYEQRVAVQGDRVLLERILGDGGASV